MSLYNMLFKENPDATALLGMLNLTRNIVPRYRDIYLTVDGDTIIILTRTGGVNRNGDYKNDILNLQKNEYYIKDYDDDFDTTYAYWEFKVPEKYKQTCKKMAPEKEVPKIHEKFDNEIKEASIEGSPASKRADEIAEMLLKAIDEGATTTDNGITFINL